LFSQDSALVRKSLCAASIATTIAGALAIAAPSAYGQAYAYTGSEQIYIVPSGTTVLHVVAVGAPGGRGSLAQGSMGAAVSADLPVPQGQGVLYVEVGGTGDGFNGGGVPDGGDASDVRLIGRAQPGSIDSRVIVAGGGGGAGQYGGGNGGADGGGGPAGGKAGTATAGGAGGFGQPPEPCTDGNSGSLGTGGDGAGGFFGSEAFGGGGGGYYGGGGGGGIGGCGFPSYYLSPLGGGGGGSSYVSPQALNVTMGLDATRTATVTIAPVTPIQVTSVPTPSASALSGLSINPRTFALGGRLVGGHCVPRTHRNTTAHPCRRAVALRVAYTLSAPATATFTLQRVLPGRLVGGRCVAPARANRRARACSHTIKLAGSFTQGGVAGKNSVLFGGRIGGRPVGPGSYLLTAVAGNPNGGSRQSVPFQLLP
jgi:hypothetical protein